MTEKERRLEMAVRNPEQIIETPEEVMERERLHALYVNSNSHLNKPIGYYEAGWKAAKAYFDVQD